MVQEGKQRVTHRRCSWKIAWGQLTTRMQQALTGGQHSGFYKYADFIQGTPEHKGHHTVVADIAPGTYSSEV